MKKQVFNPYLPSYEYIPDGEPRIFNGRLYIFGSHDKFGGKWYCENDYVTWSAPISDLSDWRYEGIIYRKDQDPRPGNLYAPDVIQGLDGQYYLYYSKADSSVIGVARADRPAGPYVFYGEVSYPDGRIVGEAKSEWYQFDPSVLIDNGRIWLYSGSGQYDQQRRFKQKMVGCMVMELEVDMKTVKTGPDILLPGSKSWTTDAYFEGASARKIGKLYYLVYPVRNGSGLHYAISQYPDRDFELQGRIHSTSDFGINGHHFFNLAYPMGNNHGGLVCINEQWFIFDHRTTNRSQFSRQGIAAPITIEEDGTIQQVEATSCGLNGVPLKGTGTYPAYIACNLMSRKWFGFFRHPLKNPFVTQDGEDDDEAAECYISGIKNGYTVGYKYFEFLSKNGTMRSKVRCTGRGTVEIATDENCRNVIGTFKLDPSKQWVTLRCKYHVNKGTHALFFRYHGTGSMELLEFELKPERSKNSSD
jgi:arabinoxylan arabinofuranohydrolase